MNVQVRRRKGIVVRVLKIIALVVTTRLAISFLLSESKNTEDQHINQTQNESSEKDSDSKQTKTGEKMSFKLNEVPFEESRLQEGLGAPPERQGPQGEMGKPVIILNMTPEEEELIIDGLDKHSFNEYISDLVSLNRTLPDLRSNECRGVEYMKSLPSTSVIICFHNEAWSTLLRTIHSVWNRSPPELIKEIILVDDYSDMRHLEEPLDTYISEHFPADKVRILRNKEREGLIRARLKGFSASSGEIVTFLDSHCECTEGWLEPLLDRIARNETTVACPMVDTIDSQTFEYRSAKPVMGGFSWNLEFRWHELPVREIKRRKNNWEPIRSPVMAGGIFSINRIFFEKLGAYDNGFNIYGAEQLELSFKAWMCGGTLELLPCSRVGHIYRQKIPYDWGGNSKDIVKRNKLRLAKVWMDNYADLYYQKIKYDLVKTGDVTEREALRQRLNCKPFVWYLKNVYPELLIPSPIIAKGEVRNLGFDADICLDSKALKDVSPNPLGLYTCHGQQGNQFWVLSETGEIRKDDNCLDYAGKDIILYECHGQQGNQRWIYDHQQHQLKHSAGKCLGMDEEMTSLRMAECDLHDEKQLWKFQILVSPRKNLTAKPK